MCPLWPIQQIILYLLVLGPIWLGSFKVLGIAAQSINLTPKWNVTYNPADPEPVLVDTTQTIEVDFGQLNVGVNDKVWIDFVIDDEHIAKLSSSPVELTPGEEAITSFNVTGNFLGYAEVCPQITYYSSIENRTTTEGAECLELTVIRESRPIDKAFTFSVVGLVCIMYVNMGAALDLSIVKANVKRPIGPLIGFFSQFVIMPLLAFGISKWLMPDFPRLQLGLFITGCSPGGGASNIWTLALGGNLDLSITMTTISTVAAFAMMPLWVFTLGATIFDEADLGVPYQGLAEYTFALVVPLIIGLLIRRYSVKVANILVRILKPFAIFLIVFIVVFAIYTNLYLFELLSLEILAAGFLLPSLGYILGGGCGAVMKQDWKDIVAIAVETGVQNTGLSIFALRVSLPQPAADLTTALPVAVAIMTPIIPTLTLIVVKLLECRKRQAYVCFK